MEAYLPGQSILHSTLQTPTDEFTSVQTDIWGLMTQYSLVPVSLSAIFNNSCLLDPYSLN